MIQNKNEREHVIGDFQLSNNGYDVLNESYFMLYDGTGKGSEMRGWLTWPKEYLNSDEYQRVKDTAGKIIADSDAVVIVGIGGSYLTPEMIIRSEYGDYYNEIAHTKGLPKMYYAGCDLSPDNLKQILERISDLDWSIIYVSKSGGTMEPALAFRVLWEKLYEQYGEEADKRVYAVTDAKKGTLKAMANEHGWESFVIPDGIGGRFSGLTAVGLLPIAVAGIDTDLLLEGAIDAMEDCDYNSDSFAGQYALYRNQNYAYGVNCSQGTETFIEFLATNTTRLSYCTEWLKQLFGESEGKEHEGLFPASGVFPRDLHSLGQYLQEGGPGGLIFETFIIRDFNTDIEIPESSLKDQLDSRVGKKFSQAALAAMDGAYKAHTKGGNKCGIIRVGNTLEDMGYFMQSMFVACAVSAYMLEVNPFDQPGVEAHKKAMKTSSKWDE